MHAGIFITGFWFGTFKFMFAHWFTSLAASGFDHDPTFLDIFLSVQIGCTVSMSVFYFSSSFMMKFAAQRRHKKEQAAIAAGKTLKPKKKFTRVNKGIVWIKRTIGIYGITFFAPLVMSIPIGSVVCAKFYGDKKITFPLMVLFTIGYSFLITSLLIFA